MNNAPSLRRTRRLSKPRFPLRTRKSAFETLESRTLLTAVAVEDRFSTLPGVTLTIDARSGVLANDTDTSGNPLTAVLFKDPAQGKLNLGTEGNFTYTPNPGFSGDDFFTYAARDSIGAVSLPVTVFISVTALPTATNDAFQTPQDTPLVIAAPGVLANDQDPEKQPLSAVLVSSVPPAAGQLTLASDGSFRFVPARGFVGTTSFAYRATAGDRTSQPATVTLTVTAPPVPVPPPPPPGIRLNRGVLQITGSSGTDTLAIFLGKNKVQISGTLGQTQVQRTIASRSVTRLVARLGDGNDLLQLDGKLKTTILIDGGAGNDVLMTCEHSGSAILLGGDGNDVIMGGHRGDIVIGGAGEDQLSGDEGNDLVIGGATQFDQNEQALFALLTEWTSTRSLSQRLNNLRTGSGPALAPLRIRLAAGQTVFDSHVDTLFGDGGGADWFFADPAIDKLRDWAATEPFDPQPANP
jgi:Ca2+-binding RTX toxin-like protein